MSLLCLIGIHRWRGKYIAAGTWPGMYHQCARCGVSR